MAGHSILQVVGGSQPAGPLFWVGIITLLLTVLGCPCVVGFFLLGSDAPEIEDPESFRAILLVGGGCLFSMFLVLSIALAAAGRPRKRP
jgi:hypothetical protein